MTDANRTVRYRYDPLFDCLHLADISPIGVRGKYWSSMTLTEQQGVIRHRDRRIWWVYRL